MAAVGMVRGNLITDIQSMQIGKEAAMGRDLAHLWSSSSPGPDTPRALCEARRVDTGLGGFHKLLQGPETPLLVWKLV